MLLTPTPSTSAHATGSNLQMILATFLIRSRDELSNAKAPSVSVSFALISFQFLSLKSGDNPSGLVLFDWTRISSGPLPVRPRRLIQNKLST